MGKKNLNALGIPWMTVPEWGPVRQISVFHREQDTSPLPETGAPQNFHVLVRGTAVLPPGKCTLYISADDYCQIWLDGAFLGMGPAPAYPSDYHAMEYTVEGGRIVTVALHLYYQGLINRVWNSGDGRFGVWAAFLQNEKEAARCDESWRYRICNAYSGKVIGYDTQFTEDFDSRLWDEDWNQPDFDDSDWKHLVSAAWADYHLSPQPTDHLSFERMLPAVWKSVSAEDAASAGGQSAGAEDAVSAARQSISSEETASAVPQSILKEQGGVLLDFGQELVGYLHVRMEGRAGQQILLRFGEELQENGRVRSELRCGCSYEERWTLRDGLNVLHPFDYKAFRYAEILYTKGSDERIPDAAAWEGTENSSAAKNEIRDERGDAPVITECLAYFRHYPMPEDLCTLSCPSGQMEDIFRICKNGVRCGTQEAYLDCPTREKGQYLGDAVITARSQVWLSGNTDMLRKCIRDFIQSSQVTPGLLAVAPGALMQEIADFSLLFPALPLTDYDFTGDLAFLRECYPAVCDIIRTYGRYRRGDGLLEQVAESWNLVDWPENMRDGYDFCLSRPVVGAGCHNVINALWYGANLMRERMEQLLGLPVTEDSRSIGAAFVKTFYRKDCRLFADSETSGHCSLHANLYAACFGLLPEEARDTYEELLLDPGRCCGVTPMYYALRSLGAIGKYETMYRLLTKDDEHSWRNMLREGATACFEAWGKEQKWNTSLCHPWASGAIPLIIEELAGIKPDPREPDGYRFEPHLPEKMGKFDLQVPLWGKRLQVSYSGFMSEGGIKICCIPS